MSVGQRDEHTGYMTTGHEWNGITELNTPVPRVVLFFLALAFVIALAMWILLPSFPLGTSYAPGLLGIDQRDTVEHSLLRAKKERRAWMDVVAQAEFSEIRSDRELLNKVRQSGKTLFQDNCAVCHGIDGGGGKGFPSLVDASWLWGGDFDTIEETIRVGINSAHEDTRSSEMPAFGRDQLLEDEDIDNVVAYIQSLSQSPNDQNDKTAITQGRAVFDENCAACHGETATGNHDMGAPDLTDAHWIYGGDAKSLRETLWGGRAGHMPHWDGRLTAVERKLLTVYIQDLAQSQAAASKP